MRFNQSSTDDEPDSGPKHPDGPPMEPPSPAHRWCKRCGDWRLPDLSARGVCTSCRCALPGSMLAAKRPVDTGRREELRRQNHAYYQPDSPHLQLLCDRKAHVDERLDAL